MNTPVKSSLRLKTFQREDIARLSMTSGGILGWDTGLGKTIGGIGYALVAGGFHRVGDTVQPKQSWLFVVPGDLHDQFIAEGEKLFRTTFTRLETQQDFLDHVTAFSPEGAPLVRPGFYITSYTQLASNGRRPWPKAEDFDTPSLARMLCLGEPAAARHFGERGEHWSRAYSNLECTIEMSADEVREQAGSKIRALEMERERCHNADAAAGISATIASLRRDKETLLMLTGPNRNPVWSDLDAKQHEFIHRHLLETSLADYQCGDGQTRNGITCLYSTTMADLACDTFHGVVIDEGVKMKSPDTLIGQGVCKMRPQHRLILSATPIKNRLPDFFQLGWWACGGHEQATARFPYAAGEQARTEFSETFLIAESNVTKEAKAREQGRGGRFKKLTPQVCNIHRLWKMLAPIVVRRRKDETGETVVSKNWHPIRCPMGTEQAEVYKWHLEAEYVDRNNMPATAVQLQALRLAAISPTSCNMPKNLKQMPKSGKVRSSQSFTPKIAATLRVIQQCLERGEQVLVGSAFLDGLDTIGAHLDQAGVRWVNLDGRVSPKRRSKLAAEFKKGPRPGGVMVALGGVESVAEGHNFYLCRNVILISYSWAYDKFEQFINRAHRMTSPQDVNVYPIMTDGSMDARLENSIREKGDAAELVLDGRLREKEQKEMTLYELFTEAGTTFRQNKDRTVCERQLIENEWPVIRKRLTASARAWHSAPAPMPVVTEMPTRTAEPALEDRERRTGERIKIPREVVHAGKVSPTILHVNFKDENYTPELSTKTPPAAAPEQPKPMKPWMRALRARRAAAR